jgi:hypothetical protein
MIGAHIILHLGLCNAMMHVPPNTMITTHVRMVDRIGRPHVDQNLAFKRRYEPLGIVEFDSPPGEYQLQISAGQYRCYAADYLFILNGHDRTINEQLVDGAPVLTQPMLMDGSAPPSFLYLSPTYVLFDKNTQCNKPVGDPIPAHIVVEDDQDSFYIWIYPDATLMSQAPEIVALQLATSTGEDHYVRLKIPFPPPWRGFPNNYQFNITEDAIDGLAGQPTGVLLCPKIFETSVG